MYASLHAFLLAVAEADNDREVELGAWCPTKLDFLLSGGHELRDMALVDGLNSVDDLSIEVTLRSAGQNSDQPWTIAIAHVAAVRHSWPSGADRDAARTVTGEAS